MDTQAENSPKVSMYRRQYVYVSGKELCSNISKQRVQMSCRADTATCTFHQILAKYSETPTCVEVCPVLHNFRRVVIDDTAPSINFNDKLTVFVSLHVRAVLGRFETAIYTTLRKHFKELSFAIVGASRKSRPEARRQELLQ